MSDEDAEPENVVPEGVKFDDIIKESNDHIKRIGWSKKQAQKYLIKRYGKRSRQVLTDKELLEFLAYLRNLK